MDEKEIWKNDSNSDSWILTKDHNGKLVSTPVRAHNQVMITTEERQINQTRAYSPAVDIFSNGSLSPVRLLEDADDYAEIASNPNLLSEDDMKAIFKLTAAKFKARLAEIDNATAISRIMEIANSESEEVTVSMPQFKAIERRLAEVTHGPVVTEVSQTAVGPTIKQDPAINF
jgi:hypothetical protein